MPSCGASDYWNGSVCVATRVCTSTEYESTPPTTTRDRVCAALTVCTGIEYELQETVGAGGSGDVWLAQAQGSLWAVKVLKAGADHKKIERFDREASFQESCGHDHVVPVIGRGEHEGHPFYIMRYYPETLRRVIGRGGADARTLLSYVEQIGAALEAADCAVIVTAHTEYDWPWIVEHSQLIVDTRNATRDVVALPGQVVRL